MRFDILVRCEKRDRKRGILSRHWCCVARDNEYHTCQKRPCCLPAGSALRVRAAQV